MCALLMCYIRCSNTLVMLILFVFFKFAKAGRGLTWDLFGFCSFSLSKAAPKTTWLLRPLLVDCFVPPQWYSLYPLAALYLNRTPRLGNHHCPLASKECFSIRASSTRITLAISHPSIEILCTDCLVFLYPLEALYLRKTPWLDNHQWGN